MRLLELGARHVKLLAPIRDDASELGHLRVPHQFSGDLHVVPRLVVAIELHLVERAPIPTIADEPSPEQQLVDSDDGVSVPSGVGQRLHLAKHRIGKRRHDIERAVIEPNGFVELLERDVVARE